MMSQKDVGNKIPIYKLKTTNEVMKYYDEWGDKNKYNKDAIIFDDDAITYISNLLNCSDEDADMYETNLMRRLSGLLYLNPKVVGDIKEKVRQKKI